MIKQERAARTRHELILSAATVLDRHGYAEATLRMVSEGAGVSRGALHFHFENKAAVGAAVESQAAQTLRTAVREVRANRGSALQALTDASHALARTLRRDVVARAGFRLGREATYEGSLDLPKEWQGFVGRMLAEAGAEGALRPDLPQRQFAAAVIAATTGFEALGRDDPKWMSRCTLTDFWELMLPCAARDAALRDLDPAGREPASPPGDGEMPPRRMLEEEAVPVAGPAPGSPLGDR